MADAAPLPEGWSKHFSNTWKKDYWSDPRHLLPRVKFETIGAQLVRRKVGRNTITGGVPVTVTVTEPITCYRSREGLFSVCLASGNQRRSSYRPALVRRCAPRRAPQLPADLNIPLLHRFNAKTGKQSWEPPAAEAASGHPQVPAEAQPETRNPKP